MKEGSGIRILLGLMAREAKYCCQRRFPFLVIVDRDIDCERTDIEN